MMDRIQASSLGYVLIGVMMVGLTLWRLILWVRDAPSRPDPWGKEVEAALGQAEDTPICHHCSTPHHPAAWFCDYCGSAVGPYNNYMPYVNVFSEGEVFRNGVLNRIRIGPLTIVGYLLAPLPNLALLAPVYWFLFFRKLSRSRDVNRTGTETPPA